LKVESDGNIYPIESGAPDVEESLKKLSTGDLISGSGVFTDSGKISLEYIDYVGLRRMLGKWISSDGLLQVKNFSEMKFYPHTNSDTETTVPMTLANVPKTFQYSVTPSGGKAWVLFLSDANAKTTTFATIQINGANATLKTFDSETGGVTKTLRLVKWGNH
jgi:hypothetical protein